MRICTACDGDGEILFQGGPIKEMTVSIPQTAVDIICTHMY